MALSRKMLSLAALCGLAWSQTGLTTIQDTLFKADGARFNGTLTIRWSTFDASNGNTIVQQTKKVTVANGNLLVQLTPNIAAPPPANTYTVSYQSDGREQFAETWTVPVSTASLKVSAVRTGTQNSSGGGSVGNQAPILESSVIGLVGDLANRPVKGAGFGTNRVAIVNDAGAIETAVGGVGDCVFVDGTGGPCGQPLFADAETPGGIVDGSNTTLTLANPPIGASLILFRNGLYLTANFDYTLTGTSLVFAPGAVLQPGDTLAAFYRVDTTTAGEISDGTTTPVAALHTGVAQVICSSTGSNTSAAAWAILAGCEIPTAGLLAGDRIEVRFTFAHSGTASGFDLQVNWGNTPILARHGAAQDAAVAGRAEGAITSTGAQLSVESWGTVLPFLPVILNAPLQSGLKVDFRAALSSAGFDTIALTNFTVLRYPGL